MVDVCAIRQQRIRDHAATLVLPECFKGDVLPEEQFQRGLLGSLAESLAEIYASLRVVRWRTQLDLVIVIW